MLWRKNDNNLFVLEKSTALISGYSLPGRNIVKYEGDEPDTKLYGQKLERRILTTPFR